MDSKIEFRDVSVSYGKDVALKNINIQIPQNEIFGIIGPANAGKTTFLKAINRTLEFVHSAKVTGAVLFDGENVGQIPKNEIAHACKTSILKTINQSWKFLRRDTTNATTPLAQNNNTRARNVFGLRRKVGVVFPLPVGLPMSIYENVAYAPRRSGVHDKQDLEEIVVRCLKQAMLWDEVKDRLHMLGTKLSGGQQQRLTIARALSHSPEVLCLDEFSIAIDPVTTMKIEDVLTELKDEMTIILVTNLVQQARRLADQTAFFNKSELVEVGNTEKIFTNPKNQLTYDYVT